VDGKQKNGGLSTKTALYVDELRKIPGPSSKRGLYEDGKQKNGGLSTKTALYVDELRKNESL